MLEAWGQPGEDARRGKRPLVAGSDADQPLARTLAPRDCERKSHHGGGGEHKLCVGQVWLQEGPNVRPPHAGVACKRRQADEAVNRDSCNS
jgi:hypothetical protein